MTATIDRIGDIAGPHRGQPVLAAGAPLGEARAAMVMLHGRGGGGQDILNMAVHFEPPGFAYLAPSAAGNTWYPNSFLAPLASNEPKLSSALAAIGDLLGQLEAAGIPPARVMLMGFSQGACLALEYAARHARRYGGVAALSGGLIGPEVAPPVGAGSLAATPVFLGCSDVDPHIPLARVQVSASVMRELGGDVTARIYPGLGHVINQDEIDTVNAMMAALLNSAQPR